MIHPASTTHSQETLEELEDQGIHQGTIRLSIGLENIDDIIEDLESGFKPCANPVWPSDFGLKQLSGGPLHHEKGVLRAARFALRL